ncbi:hypothetical protein FA13DRAFT_1712134 [Coprinellus micaceus]|uniref:Uncharacterized protein n=1 Tax=Coprinellus micaceus TaxID=71717 RepID=A0A4Y7T3B9_COPMI|nr:hypothetical protein FA13DRAFT_1712134 [Coprinellus micaceus]
MRAFGLDEPASYPSGGGATKDISEFRSFDAQQSPTLRYCQRQWNTGSPCSETSAPNPDIQPACHQADLLSEQHGNPQISSHSGSIDKVQFEFPSRVDVEERKRRRLENSNADQIGRADPNPKESFPILYLLTSPTPESSVLRRPSQIFVINEATQRFQWSSIARNHPPVFGATWGTEDGRLKSQHINTIGRFKRPAEILSSSGLPLPPRNTMTHPRSREQQQRRHPRQQPPTWTNTTTSASETTLATLAAPKSVT